MGKKIRVRETAIPPVRVAGSKVRRIDPRAVASALGAEREPEERRTAPVGPVPLFAVREALLRRRPSSGDRPGLEGTNLRAQIPLTGHEWARLEELASALSATGFSPNAGQVASVLLSMALDSVTEQLTQE